MFDFHPAEVPLSTYSSTMCTNLQPILLFSGRFSRINLHILFIYLFCKVPLNKGSQDTRAGQGRKEGRRRGAPCGPLSAPSFVWGRLLSSPPVLHPPLLSSGPLPSFPSHPRSLSLSTPPPDREKPVFGSQREGERVLWEESQRVFLREGAEWRELGSHPQEAALLWTPKTPNTSRTTGLREKKRKRSAKRGRQKCQMMMMMTSDLGDS